MKTRKPPVRSGRAVDKSHSDSTLVRNLAKHPSKIVVATVKSKRDDAKVKHCENESYDEIYEMFKREERLKKNEKRKENKKKTTATGNGIVLKNIQVSTPSNAQAKGKRKKHFEFGVSPILIHGSGARDDDKTTRELCDSLRRQRLKEIREQEKIMESSAILRAKALLERLQAQSKASLAIPSDDMWKGFKSTVLSKRQLSLDDSEEIIIARKSIRRSSTSQKSDEGDVGVSSCDGDAAVDRSESLSVPSDDLMHDNASQSSIHSELSVPQRLDESSMKIQKTDENEPSFKAPSSNLISDRSSKQRLSSGVTTRRSTRRTVAFADENSSNRINQNEVSETAESVLKPGKGWRRSLIERRRSKARLSVKQPDVIQEETVNDSALLVEQSDEGNLHAALSILDGSIKCASTFHVQRKTFQRSTSVYERSSIFYGLQTSSILIDTTHASSSSPPPTPLSARQIALRRCGQQEPLPFDEVYSESQLPNCVKIGEGVFGEVFMFKCPSTNQPVVLKIIPIEGRIPVNGEAQKKFDEILQEIIISVELSALRNGQDNTTDGFVNVKRVTCVKGAYPTHLIDEWELFRDNRPEGSENDHPEIFDDEQLYIVFELCNGGRDLEAFVFNNALEAQSIFYQTALTLAVAEQKFEFEHRDLHWGNILIAPTTAKTVEYRINGKSIKLLTHGVKVTIIDYSLSRMVYDGAVLYDDLARDEELFEASGDYQFDIYRLMRQRVENDFERFEPFTNLLWLHYMIDKLINGARYRYTKTKKHRAAINDLMLERDELLNFASASDYAKHMNF